MQNRVRRNKRWIIEWFTLHFSMLPPEFCLSECNSAKKQTQIHSSFQYFNASICHNTHHLKRSEPVGSPHQLSLLNQKSSWTSASFFFSLMSSETAFETVTWISGCSKLAKRMGPSWENGIQPLMEKELYNIFGLVNKSLELWSAINYWNQINSNNYTDYPNLVPHDMASDLFMKTLAQYESQLQYHSILTTKWNMGSSNSQCY